MELEDLKRSWEQYDKKLSESLKLNEELLRRSTLERSRRAMNTPLMYASLSLAPCLVFALLFFSWTVIYAKTPLILLSGICITAYMIFGTICLFWEIGMLRKIDYYNAPVLDLQKQLTAFRTFYHKVKKVELFALPVVLLSGFAFLSDVFYKIGLHKVNILSYPKVFVINFLIMVPITYFLLIWIYRNWYDKKVKSANLFLSELEEFEKE